MVVETCVNKKGPEFEGIWQVGPGCSSLWISERCRLCPKPISCHHKHKVPIMLHGSFSQSLHMSGRGVGVNIHPQVCLLSPFVHILEGSQGTSG